MSPSNSSHIAQSPLNDPSTEVATLDGATLDGDKSPSGIANADLEKATPIEDGEDDAPPDGGFEAWVVMIGCACAGFCTFGFANAFGVFQAYYEDVIPGANQSTIAWIGSLQYALVFLPGLLSGEMTDRGWFKIPMFCASVVLVTSLFLVAQCSTLWQLILCQGFAIGGSGGFIFLPSLSIVPQWFDKRRGRAYGVVALGSSFGGTILPIILRKLLTSVGFQWTIRVLAFIILALMIVVNLTVRLRVKTPKRDRIVVPLSALFKIRSLMIYRVGLTAVWMGLYVPLAFLDVSAQRIGVPASKSFYTIVLANAASGVGRVSSGFWADYLGSMNVLILFSFIAALMSYAWPYADSFAALLVVAALYGFSSGAFLSLLPSAASYMVPRHMVGRAIGTSGLTMAFGALVSTPIAGQILITTGSFKDVGAYAGSVVILACCVLLGCRYVILGQWKGKC